MTPDTPQARLGVLERQMATLEQKVHDVVRDVDLLAPVQLAVVRIEEQIRTIRTEITSLREALTEDRRATKKSNEALTKELHEMREESAKSDRDAKRTLKAGLWGVGAAVIMAAGGIVASGVHP